VCELQDAQKELEREAVKERARAMSVDRKIDPLLEELEILSEEKRAMAEQADLVSALNMRQRKHLEQLQESRAVALQLAEDNAALDVQRRTTHSQEAGTLRSQVGILRQHVEVLSTALQGHVETFSTNENAKIGARERGRVSESSKIIRGKKWASTPPSPPCVRTLSLKKVAAATAAIEAATEVTEKLDAVAVGAMPEMLLNPSTTTSPTTSPSTSAVQDRIARAQQEWRRQLPKGQAAKVEEAETALASSKRNQRGGEDGRRGKEDGVGVGAAKSKASSVTEPLGKRLRAFYERHNPTKLEEFGGKLVDKLASKYDGRERKLNALLRRTYDGVDLTTPIVVQSRARAQQSLGADEGRAENNKAGNQVGRAAGAQIDNTVATSPGGGGAIPAPAPVSSSALAPVIDSCAPSPTQSIAKEFEAELTLYLRKHAPAKVANVPGLLQRFKGREPELLRKVKKKYGS
jgi:hypothetical protein